MTKRSRVAPGDYNANAGSIVAARREPLDRERSPTPARPPGPKKNSYAIALGRKGGKARPAALTAGERHSIAVKAVRARSGIEKHG